MAATTPFHVRLDDDQAKQLDRLAKKFRVKEIDVIRWAIDALIAYIEKHDGHLHLPIDFDALWEKILLTAPSKLDEHGRPFRVTKFIETIADLPMVAEDAPPPKKRKSR